MEKEAVMSYRTALCEAANISGFENDSRNDTDLVKNIMERVIEFLMPSSNSHAAEHLVGLQSQVQDVIRLLNHQNSGNVQLVGIWGMSGIGKTTIAKAIYNQINNHFEVHMFFRKIRKIHQDGGLVTLQGRLLSGNHQTVGIKIHNIKSGKDSSEERHCCAKVLLVLDNVEKMGQLGSLYSPECREWFCPGSIIIIITRDKYFLNILRADHVYRVREMVESESVELLSWHAFKQATPKEDFARLSGDVSAYCGGLPLALEILGSELFGRSIEEWETLLDSLESHPHPVLENVLKVSYDSCTFSEQRIFHHIARFFIGMDKNEVAKILNKPESDVESGLKTLEDQGLIIVDQNKKLGMHILLQDMGRRKLGSEPIPKRKMYDVFLSFRGKDTRASFISHLHTYLENAGINVFKDNDNIQRGNEISISLLDAIKRSSISIIVLSTNYANSRWCLLELENIMESRRTIGLVVVPVFLDVDPSEVRNQSGMFGQAFEDLIEKKSMKEDKVKIWRKALLEIGGIAGFVILESGNESEDIKKVVEYVTRLLDRTALFVANHPVGVESRVQDVVKLLNNRQSKDPLLVGIWGMGGIGKTTIAKAVYNEIGRKFKGRSFLLNVREAWEQDNGGTRLQEQLLSDIYKTMRTKINNTESGKFILEQRLSQKRVLIVLDDVDKSEQLNALFGSHKWFAPESIIIITTRNSHLLTVHSVDCVYKIEQLDRKECTELFSWHAFKEPSPKKEFIGLSKNVVAYAGGLPLALEVVGAYLFGRGTKEWKSVLKQLKSIPNEEVHRKLKISFHGLNSPQKEIFLDIVFFFIGMKRNDTITILHDCGHAAENGIHVLEERCLITIDNSDKLRMHDLLRDMGREIIREKSPKKPEKRSRLWDPKDVLDVLTKDMGTKAIEGLALKLPTMNEVHLKTEAFKNMKRLKLLQLAGVQINGDFKYLSGDLTWLSWNGFPLKCSPENFDQRNLVAIDLKYSNLQLVWKTGQMLKKLKILNLSHSHYLIQTPNFLYLPNLQNLILKDCPSLTLICPTIEHLNQLLLLNLKDCTSLHELPRGIYKLKSLKTLIFSGCSKIDKLEDDIEQMESLITLKVDHTAITRVPYSIVRLKNIAYISYCGYEGLTRDAIPSIIWSWTSATNKLPSLMPTSPGMLFPVSTDVPNSKFHGLPPVLSGEVALDTMNATSCMKGEELPTTSQVSATEVSALTDCHNFRSKKSLSFLLIQMGINCPVTEILRESISQTLFTSGPGNCSLPAEKSPDWLTFNNKGSSVIFEVPQVNGRKLKTTTLCMVYSSSPSITTSEGLQNVLIINYTKATIQIYERDALKSIEDVNRQSIISILEPGNKVQFTVMSTYGFIVQKTAIYLIYEPVEGKLKHFRAPAPEMQDPQLKIPEHTFNEEKPLMTALSPKKRRKDQECSLFLTSPQTAKASMETTVDNRQQVAETQNADHSEEAHVPSPRQNPKNLDLAFQETTLAPDQGKEPVEKTIENSKPMYKAAVKDLAEANASFGLKVVEEEDIPIQGKRKTPSTSQHPKPAPKAMAQEPPRPPSSKPPVSSSLASEPTLNFSKGQEYLDKEATPATSGTERYCCKQQFTKKKSKATSTESHHTQVQLHQKETAHDSTSEEVSKSVENPVRDTTPATQIVPHVASSQSLASALTCQPSEPPSQFVHSAQEVLAELEKVLSDSQLDSTKIVAVSDLHAQVPNVSTLLQSLENLLAHPPEDLSVKNDLKEKANSILEQLLIIKAQLPNKILLAIHQCKCFFDNLFTSYPSTHLTIQDYTKLLRLKADLTENLVSTEEVRCKLSNSVDKAKKHLTELDVEIADLEAKLKQLTDRRKNVDCILENCEVKHGKLAAQATDWHNQRKLVVQALKESKESYESAQVVKKEVEVEQAKLRLVLATVE